MLPLLLRLIPEFPPVPLRALPDWPTNATDRACAPSSDRWPESACESRPALPPRPRIRAQIVFRAAAEFSGPGTDFARRLIPQFADRHDARPRDKRNRRDREHRPHCTAPHGAAPRHRRAGSSRSNWSPPPPGRRPPGLPANTRATLIRSFPPAPIREPTGWHRAQPRGRGRRSQAGRRSWAHRLFLRTALDFASGPASHELPRPPTRQPEIRAIPYHCAGRKIAAESRPIHAVSDIVPINVRAHLALRWRRSDIRLAAP